MDTLVTLDRPSDPQSYIKCAGLGLSVSALLSGAQSAVCKAHVRVGIVENPRIKLSVICLIGILHKA